MIRKISALSIARPRIALGAWVALTLLLAVVGRDVINVLHDTDIVIPGTRSAAAVDATNAQFGEATEIVVMLEGPARQLDRQGPALARQLDRLPATDVLSAWSPGDADPLRRRPDQALLILRVHKPLEETMERVLPLARGSIDQTVSPPVQSHMTGTPPIAEAMVKEGYSAAERAERIAAPIVLIVLLLVFRSPIAALLPALLGFAVIASGRGALAIIGHGVQLDTLAMSLMSMMGLALGVDYSLLLVSRFREELDKGRDPREAARVAAGTAGRTVMFAGLVLVVAMTIAVILAPGTMLVSAAVGIIGATVLSLVGGLFALPAALVLAGHNVNRWRLGHGNRPSSAAAMAKRATRRPVLAMALVLVPLLLMAVPASAVKLGIPSIKNLPSDNRARQDFEAIRDTFGPGWAAPFEILVVSDKGPVTDPKRLAALERFQRDLAKSPNIESVVGPGILAKPAREAQRAADNLEKSQGRLARLDKGLNRAERGSRKLKDGMREAATGAGRVAAGASTASSGVDQTASGANALAGGAEQSADGSRRLADALRRTDKGTRELASGALDAKRGADDLARPAHRLARGLKGGEADMAELRDAAGDAEGELTGALAALDAMSVAAKTDPKYRTAYEQVATALGTLSGKDPLTGEAVRARYKGMAASVDEAAAESAEAGRGADRLARGAKRLRGGLVDLRRGAVKLRRATGRTQVAALKLTGGLGQLQAGSQDLSRGAQRLDAGMSRLNSGADRLHEELSGGAPQAQTLTSGLERMGSGVERMSAKPGANGATASDQAKALDSGYFVMAGLDSSSASEKEAASFAVNVAQGGTAARITVVPAAHTNRGTTETLQPELERAATRLGNDLGVEAAVGGRAAIMRDYTAQASKNRLPLIAALLAITFLLLIVVFRSLLMALKAVVLNLLTVAAAFGALDLVFQGSSPLLGGPGWIDIIAFYGIYTIVFALSMDYEVFLITRMREGFLATGSNRGAIEYGIERTAGIITGAAAIMAAVFVAFTLSGVGELMQFGVGLTVAVLVDATVIRLILLPATMRLFGRANWWLPKWLDRLLPNLDVEGDATVKPIVPRPQFEAVS